MIRIYFSCALWALTVFAVSCGSPYTGQHVSDISGSAAVVVTTDYRTGSLAVISLDHKEVDKDFSHIHPDTICRYSPITKKMYLVERMGADAIAVLNPGHGYIMESEFSVGAGTNAQDIAVVSRDRAYVARYSSSTMTVINPDTGDLLDEIDLSPWADEDGLAEPGWGVEHDGKIFVAIQRLKDFQPTDYSAILVMNSMSGKTIKEVRLAAKDPMSKLRYAPAEKAFVIGEVGVMGALDGGVELLYTDDLSTSGLMITEQELGGDIIDVVILSESKGFAIVSKTRDDFSASTSVVSFDPGTGKRLSVLAHSDEFDHSFLELDPSGRQLWVAQRKRTQPGIRIFDTFSDEEITKSPIDVGLPPFMICFANTGD